jgi:hypothetical protein
MKTPLLRSILALLLAGGISPALVAAYVDVELEGRRHIIGEYYTANDTKLTVFRASGNVEVDRSRVLSIRELPGEMPTEVQSATAQSVSAPAPAISATASPATSSSASSPSEARSDLPTDPTERDEALANSLMHLHLNRLAARQRGDDEALKKLDTEIDKAQAERKKNWKKLHPGEAEDSGEGD